MTISKFDLVAHERTPRTFTTTGASVDVTVHEIKQQPDDMEECHPRPLTLRMLRKNQSTPLQKLNLETGNLPANRTLSGELEIRLKQRHQYNRPT